MTRQELNEFVATELDTSKVDANRIVDNIFGYLKTKLFADGEVSLPEFGKLKIKKAAARSGTSPNGVKWEKPETKTVKFSASSKLKEDL